MSFQKFSDDRLIGVQNEPYNEEILSILQNYIESIAHVSHKKKEKMFKDMLLILIDKINSIAKEGDLFDVGGYLTSAAYFMEEFDYAEAQQIYMWAIEYYDKYLQKLEKEGRFQEGLNISNQIVELYHNKLQNLDEDKEKTYIQKCIEYNIALIEILEGFCEPRKLSILFFTLGENYLKMEDWENAIKTNNSALEIARENKFYDIIANIYFNLSDIFFFSGDETKAKEIIEESKEYFSEEENKVLEKGSEKEKHYRLSQIYQIQKNLYSAMNEPAEFRKYSRKEAISYIELAKEIMGDGFDCHKIGSFYRGAALCFRETESDYLDGASCFLISANIFNKCKEYREASFCFNDAAKLFEDAKYYEKAVQLYEFASKSALKNKNYEFVIEKLMNAYNLIKQKNLKMEYENLLRKINECLEKLSENEAEWKRYFISGSLLLETLPYYKELGFSNKSSKIKNNLKKILHYYEKEYFKNSERGKSSTVAYILSLYAISNIALENFDKAKELIKLLKKNYTSRIINSYVTITEEILKAKKSGISFDLSRQKRKVKKVFSNSIEIKLFNNFLFF
ncbi:MAG: tetratricopeptide repeat protein [Promethearchaeota archaeon]